MNIRNKTNNDKIYEKAKKIRTNLLLFIDKEIKQKNKKDKNKRYIKEYNIINCKSFQITFQEYYNNNIKKSIQIYPNIEKNKIPINELSFFSHCKTNTLTTLSSNSSLTTQEASFKKIPIISKKIFREKVIPESLMKLIKENRNTNVRRKRSICFYINSLTNNGCLYNDLNSNNSNNDGEEEIDIKYQKYLENLVSSVRSSPKKS